MLENVSAVEDILLNFSRLLLEIGATLVLAGIIAMAIILLLTWRPKTTKMAMVEAYRAEMMVRAELMHTGVDKRHAQV
ncbi:hypothetical protein [Corynebacterium epidermidicanis]|uniref:Uncharacterized protein n=1 Tax=Corynebacterium epidermidicanis TaxID=1050174 RepID=A0A0G3GMG0_9CORY|nr:hypothetical protein [Corynebacterium epidermidicanis]AKK02421.1 hypothetical protein CEPID_02705 [Corynebacterium epidermidicanis]